MRVYIGWDPRGALAYEVCRRSLLRHASVPVEVIPLKHWELRQRGFYWRAYKVDGRTGQMIDACEDRPFSTEFTYTRYLVPALERYGDEPVVFCDPDMIWRADVAELAGLLPQDAAVACVKHRHEPAESQKMGGLLQARYARKNWSSVMVLRPNRCTDLTLYAVNRWDKADLHAMVWAREDEIAGLPETWNWLDGHSSPALDPKIVHLTRGTPDMPGTEGVAYADEWWSYARPLLAA